MSETPAAQFLKRPNTTKEVIFAVQTARPLLVHRGKLGLGHKETEEA